MGNNINRKKFLLLFTPAVLFIFMWPKFGKKLNYYTPISVRFKRSKRRNNCIKENPLKAFRDICSDVLGERFGLLRHRAEDHPVQRIDAQALQTMLLQPEIVRQTAFAANPAPECRALQVPLQVIAPCVIDAGEALALLA